MGKANEETILLADDKADLPPEKTPYPKSVFFIIGNEFCERFSYYGMKAILILFFTKIIRYEDNLATTVYHVFAMGCYFTPVFGAMLADSLLGKFRTIFYVSILYAAGNIVLAISAIPRLLPTEIFALIGLTMIAVGTGGIKPCVSAFGGDQFGPSQERELQRFFSFFYMSINLGSLFSTILTPFLREDVWCFNQNSCFSLAFGVPAILMVVSLVLFLLGRPLYKILAPKGNIVIQVLRCIGHAISNRFKKNKEVTTSKGHWLDYAGDKYDQHFIEDIKDVLHVLFLYLPLPVFWALFDQQGSRWTLQAAAMDGDVLPRLRIKPDQMQVINPALIILFIPLFEYCIYPLLAKCHLLTRPLQRITVGGILAASSFIVAAFVEIALQQTLPQLPCEGQSQVSFLNTLPCNISINSALTNSTILHNEMAIFRKVETNYSQMLNFNAANCSNLENAVLPYDLKANGKIEVVMAANINNQLRLFKTEDDITKPEKGETKLRAFFVPKFQPTNHTVIFKLEPDKDGANMAITFENFTDSEETILITKYKQIPPLKYNMYIVVINDTIKLSGQIELKMGANYIVTVVPDEDNQDNYVWNSFVMVQPNSLSILYQIPQYIIITAGEIMFSITGLEFSYSQAPQSMKSVLQASWLLTVAFGNLIVIIVAQARMFSKQYYEFFMFAGLMIVDMIIFAIMGYFYKYVQHPNGEQELVPTSDKTSDNGVENLGYSDNSTKM